MIETNFKIAIPSYKRSKTIKDKTLSYLLECGIDMKKVFVFVANETEYDDYLYLTDSYNLNIIVGEKGIANQRNFIRKYFDEGDRILSIDDDISYLGRKVGNKIEKTTNLKVVVEKAFEICEKQKTKLFGVSAVNNAFYMSDDISTSLKFVIGAFHGFINEKDDYWLVDGNFVEGKEDYEITLKAYKKFGKVVRLNQYTPITKYYKEKGGLFDTRSPETSERAAGYLLNKYPEYVKLKGLGSNGHMEISLFDKSKTKK